MNKRIKIIISVIASAIIIYYGYGFFTFIMYRHHTEMGDFKRYLWVFKESVKSDIDTFFWNGEVKNSDIYYHYLYKDNYYVSIWEFKDLGSTELKRLNFKQGVDLTNIKFSSWEMFNKNSWPIITSKLGFSFKHTLNVNLDESSKIIRTIDSIHYKGFYGIINNMSFSDETGKHLILFDYPSSHEPTVLLLYKTAQSFYVIFINSKNKKFDESIVNILNLP